MHQILALLFAIVSFGIGWGIRPFADIDMLGKAVGSVCATPITEMGWLTIRSIQSTGKSAFLNSVDLSTTPDGAATASSSSAATTQTTNNNFTMSAEALKGSNLTCNCTACRINEMVNGTLGYRSYGGFAAHNLPPVGKWNNTRVRRLKRILKMNSTLPFALVADLDTTSNRHCDAGKFEWSSYVKLGELRYDGDSFEARWTDKLIVKASHSTNNRSMELSDITWWNGNYYAACDYTGMIYKIRPTKGDIFPRFVLADGDGKQKRTLKSEWMTGYDSQMFVGSHGKEWVQNGVIMGRGAEWVKAIDQSGQIRSLHWEKEYALLRNATGTLFPGYLSHEAVVFNHYTRQWVFLPRKASTLPFDDVLDETRGTNLLLLVSEEFSNVTVLTVGPLEPEWGFTSVALVPGSNGNALIATKVREIGDDHSTKLTVFDMRGNILLQPDQFVYVENVKYEGVEFLGEHENW